MMRHKSSKKLVALFSNSGPSATLRENGAYLTGLGVWVGLLSFVKTSLHILTFTGSSASIFLTMTRTQTLRISSQKRPLKRKESQTNRQKI